MDSFQPVIDELESKKSANTDKKIDRSLCGLLKLFRALNEMGVEPALVDEELKGLKSQLHEPLQPRLLNRTYHVVTTKLRKEKNIVTPNYYQTLWMSLGMTIFGLPFGLVFSAALDNMAFFAIGLPIGMPIGMAIGINLDKKAREEGRALVYPNEPKVL